MTTKNEVGDRDPKRNLTVWSGIAGSIFSFFSSIADVLSGFSKNHVEGLNSATKVLNFEFLVPLVKNKSFGNLLLGDYLAVLLIPASMLGIYHIHMILTRKDNLLSKVFFPLAIYTFALGAVLHAKSTLVIGAIASPQDLSGTAYWTLLQKTFTPFGWILVGLMTLILTLLTLYIALGKTPYPRKMMWVSPLFLQIYATITMILTNSALSNYFAVATWNLSMAIFFAISTFWYVKEKF